MIERLVKLCQNHNRFALKGLADAKLTYAPDSRMANSVYSKGAIYSMSNVASPSQSGPVGTDHFGLWRDNAEKKN